MDTCKKSGWMVTIATSSCSVAWVFSSSVGGAGVGALSLVDGGGVGLDVWFIAEVGAENAGGCCGDWGVAGAGLGCGERRGINL